MKRCAYVLLSVLAIGSLAHGQETATPSAQSLSKEHKHLHRDLGEWSAEMTMWMNGPDGESMSMPGTETNTLMDGGMWLISEFQSGPFKGRGQFGYDPVKKKYVGTWIDNQAPFLSVMEGTLEDGRLVMFFSGYNAHTMKEEKMKSVTEFQGDDNKLFVMYKHDAGSDKWIKAFEIKYSRKK